MKLGYLLALALLWVVYLVVERLRLDRARSAIPLRIAVTGTRGKSSVTRMLASVLRESGRTVLAKTTGSEARFILPDGSERVVRRRGAPSIMEQCRLVHRGARLGVDTLVAEVMSVHEEMHEVEAQKLVQPHQVLMTNLRVDHLSAQGGTREEVASVLAADVPAAAQVFLPESESLGVFEKEVLRRRGKLEKVASGCLKAPVAQAETVEEPGYLSYLANCDLVWAVASRLGIDEETFWAGISRTRGDLGSLRIWQYPGEGHEAPCLVVNAFAANDPQSTLQALRRVLRTVERPVADFVGLLNLRKDRGDRTLQWAEALREGALDGFGKMYVCGFHASAFRRCLRGSRIGPRIETLPFRGPENLMAGVRIGIGEKEGGVVFGFGNMGGSGRSLVEHWREVGDPVPVALEEGLVHGA